MERTAVRSRDLAIVGYDSQTHTLEIAFKSGRVYEYKDVPPDVYQGLLSASSMGTYFRDQVREAFSYRKIR